MSIFLQETSFCFELHWSLLNMTSTEGICSMVFFLIHNFSLNVVLILCVQTFLRMECQLKAGAASQAAVFEAVVCCCTCEEWAVLGKGCALWRALHPGELCWLRSTCTVVQWQVHKLMQRQITLPSQLPKLKTETGSTSSTSICSRFKQMHNGRCTMEFRSGRQERSTARSHRL